MIPRDAELWRTVLDHRLLDVHTALPATVVSYDAAGQTITAQPEALSLLMPIPDYIPANRDA